MGMKKSNAIALLGLAAAISEQTMFNSTKMSRKHIVPNKPKPIPKGAKEYFFNSAGKFSTEDMLRETVFQCCAINDKNAVRKFEKWRSSKKH